MTDHWKDVQPVYPFSESPHRNDGPACYFADSVDAARAKDAETRAAALAAKDAEIAALTADAKRGACECGDDEVCAMRAEITRLTAQVQADAHLRSVVELYRADPLAMAEALVRMRDDLGTLRATHE